MTKDWRIWAGVLGLVALVLSGLIFKDTVLAARAQGPAPRLATVIRGTVKVAVGGTGSIVPVSQVNVNFRLSGQLSEVDVKVGDHVQAGQVLARVDSRSQQAALEQARATLQSAQASLQAALNPVTPEQIAQLQHNLAAAQTAYNDTVNSVNTTNQQDASAVAADQQQLTNDQNQFNADGCATPPAPTPKPSPSPSTARCAQDRAAINQDQAKLTADQNKQQLDQANGQSRINQAQAAITAAQDALNVQTQVKPNSVASARAQVASAQAQVDAAQVNLDLTTLTAPIGGVVTIINGELGENVPSGASTTAQAPGSAAPQPATGTSAGTASAGAGSPFIVLSDTGGFQAVVAFAETDAARLKPGQEASLTYDAVPGLTITGQVVALGTSASVVSNVVNYFATLSLNRSDPRLKPGMTVNATVTVARDENVLLVPSAAIRNQNGTTMVMVQSQGRQIPTEVEVGLAGDTTTEIKAGLEEGDKVVLPAVRGQPGQRAAGGAPFGGTGIRGVPGR